MDELGRAAEVLARAPSVALACHVNPDPDALGSMLGLAAFLHARLGTDVLCSWGNQPLAPPAWIEPLVDRRWIVEAKAFPRAPEVLVCLDTASSDRLGVLSAQLARAVEVVVIDHRFADIITQGAISVRKDIEANIRARAPLRTTALSRRRSARPE